MSEGSAAILLEEDNPVDVTAVTLALEQLILPELKHLIRELTR
ncbi:MAG: hypothetical protein U1B94_09735 [candidate division NC10 bacterium]|nr:hypothetical protein [candidate division NC10 bacterium]